MHHHWTFTTIFCVLISLPSYSLATQKNKNIQSIDISMLELAYQQLILNNTEQTQQLQAQQNQLQQRAAIIAKKQLKIRYRWGGASPKKGFDCSGLIQYSFKKANILLPRTAASQYKKTKRIPLAEMKTGDLIFFHTPRRKKIRVNHVGIYLGKDQFIHAPRKGKTVTIATLNKYWKGKIVGAGRI